MRRSKLATFGYLILVFLSGMLVGGFAYRLYSVKTVMSSTERPRSPDEYRNRYVREMTARLKLAPAQVQSLQQIMDETRDRFHAMRERFAPEMKVIEEEQRQKITTMLNGSQRAEYEKMRLERERRRAAGEPKRP